MAVKNFVKQAKVFYEGSPVRAFEMVLDTPPSEKKDMTAIKKY